MKLELTQKYRLLEIFSEEGGGEKTEILILSQEKQSGPSPVVVFVHGYNTFGAWEVFFQARRLVKEGFVVLLPSQKGFGLSTGPKDFCGPRTVRGITHAVSSVLKEFPDLSTANIFLYGVSRGATVAALISAEKQIPFGAVILQSGAYDLESDRAWVDKPQGIIENMEKEIISGDGEYTSRNAISKANQITMPVLLVHGTDDANISVEQSKQMHAAIVATGGSSTLHLIEGGAHRVSSPTHTREVILPFLREHMV